MGRMTSRHRGGGANGATVIGFQTHKDGVPAKVASTSMIQTALRGGFTMLMGKSATLSPGRLDVGHTVMRGRTLISRSVTLAVV